MSYITELGIILNTTLAHWTLTEIPKKNIMHLSLLFSEISLNEFCDSPFTVP